MEVPDIILYPGLGLLIDAGEINDPCIMHAA